MSAPERGGGLRLPTPTRTHPVAPITVEAPSTLQRPPAGHVALDTMPSGIERSFVDALQHLDRMTKADGPLPVCGHPSPEQRLCAAHPDAGLMCPACERLHATAQHPHLACSACGGTLGSKWRFFGLFVSVPACLVVAPGGHVGRAPQATVEIGGLALCMRCRGRL